jgi:hypothetical protein
MIDSRRRLRMARVHRVVGRGAGRVRAFGVIAVLVIVALVALLGPAGVLAADNGQPRVAAVHPEDDAEHQRDLEQSPPVRLMHQHASQLRDGEDEDEVEEQLERGDALSLVRLAGRLAHRRITAGAGPRRGRRQSGRGSAIQ